MPTPRLASEVAKAAGRQVSSTPFASDNKSWVTGTVAAEPGDFGGDYLVNLDTGQSLPADNTMIGVAIVKGSRVFVVQNGNTCLIVGLQ